MREEDGAVSLAFGELTAVLADFGVQGRDLLVQAGELTGEVLVIGDEASDALLAFGNLGLGGFGIGAGLGLGLVESCGCGGEVGAALLDLIGKRGELGGLPFDGRPQFGADGAGFGEICGDLVDLIGQILSELCGGIAVGSGGLAGMEPAYGEAGGEDRQDDGRP